MQRFFLFFVILLLSAGTFAQTAGRETEASQKLFIKKMRFLKAAHCLFEKKHIHLAKLLT
jgi:hypothetical protein